MKIVVIGGTGLIGSKVVQRLGAQGHEALAAAPSTGVDTLTGDGLPEALAGADAVIDVSNSPSFEDAAALAFFQTTGRNLLAAEVAAGVRHHVALSVVGTDRLPASGYFRAKLAQEALIAASPIPYTILRSTQFFPFIAGIIHAGVQGGEIHLSSALVQPIAADDVAEALVDLVVGAPANAIVEIGGPERVGLDRFAEAYLEARGDRRLVVSDPAIGYFGARLEERTLLPGDHPRLGRLRLREWLADLAPAS